MDNSQVFFQAFIYLLAAVVAVPLAKRIGLGSVLGYLIAGIIIGPFALSLVGSNTENIMHFAEFGVVMMLFLVGLELRPSMLWELRKSLLLTGGLQVVLTTLVITIIAKLCGLSLATSLALGMIFTSSSTAIVLQMLHEKGWIKLNAGNTIFAILLFQDIAVIPILAFLPLLGEHSAAINNNSSGFNRWEQTLLVIAILIFIIGGSKYLLRPIFRFIANSNLNEAFTALALLLVIGISLAMNYVGLSPAMGAFIAGVVLAESEYRHELEADIEPFKGLLLGLFFISVGTNIDFTIIREHLLLICILVTALIVIKFLVLFALSKSLCNARKDSWLIALTLAQSGEFCFVLISYASQNQIFTTELARELVAVVALSMLLTPVIMMIYEKIIAPRLNDNPQQLDSDVINQDNQVIIAGFGRFGQIVSRYLLANGIKSTILDIDANQVDTVRKFGHKVFYGDAARMDLLEIAGLSKAKLLVIAIDDSDKAIKIGAMVKHSYPQLKILLRVRNRTDVYEALNTGFEREDIYRETFETALLVATQSHQFLGASVKQATDAAQIFRTLDEEQLQKMRAYYTGKMNDDYITQAKLNSEQLEKILDADSSTIKI